MPIMPRTNEEVLKTSIETLDRFRGVIASTPNESAENQEWRQLIQRFDQLTYFLRQSDAHMPQERREKTFISELPQRKEMHEQKMLDSAIFIPMRPYNMAETCETIIAQAITDVGTLMNKMNTWLADHSEEINSHTKALN